MNQFKTLAEARGAYEQLATELAETQKKTAQIAELEAQLAESKAFGSTTATENENFRLLIVQKDEEISRFQTEIKGFQAENAALSLKIGELGAELEASKKSQKTAKIHARELVAASGGVPIAVDQAEINRMQAGDEKEFLDEMAKTTDPAELSRLYREYNKLFRPNGKHKS
jgi:chromosome segregation ATPase